MILINFSEIRKKKRFLAEILVFSTLLLLLVYTVSPSLATVLGIAVLIVSFSLIVEWGFYAALLLLFMHGLEITPAGYDTFEHLRFLSGINAPIIDFIFIGLLLGLILSVLFRFYMVSFRQIPKLFPGMAWYIGFLCVAIISANGAYNGLVEESNRFIVYPMAFVYIAYVTLVVSIIQTKKILRNVMHVCGTVWIGWVFLFISIWRMATGYPICSGEHSTIWIKP